MTRPARGSTAPPPASGSGDTRSAPSRTPPAGTGSGGGVIPSGVARRWAATRSRVPRIASLLALVVGAVDVWSAVTRARSGRVRAVLEVLPGTATHIAAGATLVVGLLLLLLALGLRRGKRRAWRAAVALLIASIVLNVVKGLDIEEALLSAGLLALLLAGAGRFRAAGDPHTRWRALFAFVILLAGSVLLGLFALRLRLEGSSSSLTEQLSTVLLGLVGLNGPVLPARERDADVLGALLLGLGLVTALVPAWLALRAPSPHGRLEPADEQALRGLLDRHGQRDSLGYFALRRDKSAVFSPTGKSAVCYRVVSGVALASGDPVGDPEAWPGAIRALLDHAEGHGWVPAAIGVSEQGATAYSRAGLDALEIGDEAVVDVETFTLEGRAMRGVRQACARVERAGYAVSVRRVRDLDTDELAAVAAAASAWRGDDVERGFSMALGRFGDAADDGCLVVTAHRDGQLAGLLHFVPWGRDGLSLDLMRRDRAADNGLTELMVVTLLQGGAALGVRRVSLNFAVFRAALERGERIGAGPVLRSWRRLLLFASRWFQIESLYRFNAKFRPVWEPRYVCFPSPQDLPRIAVAWLEAEAFLVRPGPLRRLGRVLTGPSRPIDQSRSAPTERPAA